MPYRNKTYVCFDGDNDIQHYRLMKAWKANDKLDFDFYDAHDLRQCRDASTEETIKRSLRERMKNAKLFLVLVGKNTKNLFKYVRWEMELALNMNLPIIVVNLNGKRECDTTLCPPILKNKLAVHTSFHMNIIKLAIDNWPNQYFSLKKEIIENKLSEAPRYYSQKVYTSQGIK